MADNADYFSRNKQYLAPGEHTYTTSLPDAAEVKFRSWVKDNNVPFDPEAKNADYDMRGFWQALQTGDPRAATGVNPNDKKLHFSDYWKTPYHKSFSAESQWADPEKAPRWNENDQLVAPDGTVVYDERAEAKARADEMAKANSELVKQMRSQSGEGQ